MSNIVTAVKIAVDSGAIDAAKGKAEDLSETAGVKIPAGFKKAATSAVAVTAAIAAAVTAAESLSSEVEQQSQRGYDFYNTMDSQVRPAMIYIAETIEAQNAALEQQRDLATVATANMAIGWNNAKIAAGGVWNEYGLGIKNAEEATNKFIADFANNLATEQINEEGGVFNNLLGKRELIDKRSKEIQADIRKDMETMNEAAETLAQASSERRIQRLEGMNDSARERRDKQFEQEIKEREAAIVLAANTSQEAALKAELERFKEAQSNFNDYLDQQESLAEAARQTSIENEIRAAEVANMVGVEQLRARHQMEVDALLARKEAGELNALQTEQLRIEIAKKYQAEALAVQEKANADAIKVAEKAATEMSNATSSALSLIDDDLANLYDSIDSLIRALQLLDGFSALGGGGGFWGIGGGVASGGLSSFGGISVGTVSVSVQGNTDTVGMKNSAQEGVYGALNGIVKDTLAKESKYGGIFNPSSGTHRM